MKSAIYEGKVHHERLAPRRHAFVQRLFLMYLDLDELEDLFARRWFWSHRRPNLAWFRRADYLEPSDRPLDEAVRDRVEEELGRRPRGSVRVLTHLRTWGYVFNPVTFYYCFDEDERLEAVAAEITNTPWRERHTYVLDAREAVDPGELRFRFEKRFHVSPFFPMEQTYEWDLRPPGERLEVGMTNYEGGSARFRVGLACTRRPITGRSLAGVLARHPFLTFRIHLAIYWQAVRLWWKRTPFFVHPEKRAALGDASSS